jgi:hypothetical protein
MDTPIDQRKEFYGSSFRKKEGSWYNGNAYLPLVNYYWETTHLNSIIKYWYEFRCSEFTRPSFIDLGASGNRHLCRVQLSIPSSYQSKIDIYELSYFSNLLKKDKTNFKIKTNDKRMENFLKELESLNQIFEMVKISPEFSPVINGNSTKDKEHFSIQILYETQVFNTRAIDLVTSFCESFILLLNKYPKNDFVL